MSPGKVTSWTEFNNIVGGEARSSKEFYRGVNPGTGEDLWDVPVATKQDVDDAVIAARKAFKVWSTTPFQDRVKELWKFHDALQPHTADFVELLMTENGKPKVFAQGECHSALDDAFKFFLNQRLPEIVLEEEDRFASVKYVPLGIVACICPWNFPLGQATLKLLPALVAGNTVILKPSPFVPYSALKLVEIAQQVLPPGVLQVLGGHNDLGPWLTEHPDINKISFTGSTATGKKVMQAAAKTMKRVTVELGGNDPAIVCADVDVEKIAPELLFGAFFNTGQVCTATKRVYIHKDIYAPMLQALAKAAKNLKVGDAKDEGVMLGPLQNKMQYEKVKGMYEEADKGKFKMELGAEVTTSNGFFLQPRIIDDPPNDSLIMVEEQMGPIIPTQSWTDEDDVIQRANDSAMGLGASVWSKDSKHAQAIADRLEAGSIFINHMPQLSIHIPFGGVKESGVGSEGGPSCLVPYCNMKVIHHFK